MRSVKHLTAVLAPVLVLVACTTTLSDEDRASIATANQNAEAARQQSAEAVTASQAAQQSAAAAAADAKAADEKADRMFQRSLRK